MARLRQTLIHSTYRFSFAQRRFGAAFQLFESMLTVMMMLIIIIIIIITIIMKGHKQDNRAASVPGALYAKARYLFPL